MKKQKTIGLIGGMSWESTVTYYQIINNTVKKRLGGFHSAKILLASVDFAEIEAWQTAGEWEKCATKLASVAQTLQQAGANFIVICTNTMHKVVTNIEAAINIPVLHITEPTIYALQKANITKVGLIGTKYTMEEDFYKKRLEDTGIEVIIPSQDDRNIINNIIFKELCLGECNSAALNKMKHVIHALSLKGAKGIILGCTELGLLISPVDCRLPLFDTAAIHAEAAAEWSIC